MRGIGCQCCASLALTLLACGGASGASDDSSPGADGSANDATLAGDVTGSSDGASGGADTSMADDASDGAVLLDANDGASTADANDAATSPDASDAAPDATLPPDAGPPRVCVPGESIGCVGPGGCISNQVCNGEGTAYGACQCSSDGGSVLACVPGESIGCAGSGGCVSFQVCNEKGSAYGACECPEGGAIGDGGLLDGYAPLPPSVGDQGYNAIFVNGSPAAIYPLTQAIFLPLFSAPDCNVVPPYGQSYVVAFYPGDAGPAGTFSSCSQTSVNPAPCYETELSSYTSIGNWEIVPGGSYTLSAFGDGGLATGQMNTTEGIVPLVVKNCP